MPIIYDNTHFSVTRHRLQFWKASAPSNSLNFILKSCWMIGILPTNTLQNNHEHQSSHRKIERLSQLNSRITLWINLDSTCSLSPAVPLGFLSLYNKADPWGPFPKIRPEFKSNPSMEGGKKKSVFLCVMESHINVFYYWRKINQLSLGSSLVS